MYWLAFIDEGRLLPEGASSDISLSLRSSLLTLLSAMLLFELYYSRLFLTDLALGAVLAGFLDVCLGFIGCFFFLVYLGVVLLFVFFLAGLIVLGFGSFFICLVLAGCRFGAGGLVTTTLSLRLSGYLEL